MTDLDAAIRAKVAGWRENVESLRSHGEDLLALDALVEASAAIEAALDQHEPVSNEAWTSSTPSIVCSCSPGEDDHYDEPYPCRTRRAIAEKLGMEVDGD